MRAVNKRDSIYIQLLKLLVGSAAAALLIFLGLNYARDFAIDQYCYHPDYIKKNDERYVEKLQKYIDENQLAARDTKAFQFSRHIPGPSVCISHFSKSRR